MSESHGKVDCRARSETTPALSESTPSCGMVDFSGIPRIDIYHRLFKYFQLNAVMEQGSCLDGLTLQSWVSIGLPTLCEVVKPFCHIAPIHSATFSATIWDTLPDL